MARVRIYLRVQKVSGRVVTVVQTADVEVVQPGTTTRLNVYGAESGGAPLSQPFVTDARGEVTAATWIEEGTPAESLATFTYVPPDGGAPETVTGRERLHPVSESVVTRLGSVERELPDSTSAVDRVPFVWDADTAKLVPATQSILLESGATQLGITYTTPVTGWAAVNAVRPIHLEANYVATDVPVVSGAPANSYQGITSTVNFGNDSAAPAVGTTHNFSARHVVKSGGNVDNEHAAYFGFVRYENGTPGRCWFTDWNVHGPVGVQPERLVGITMFINNYYNGVPHDTPSAGQWLVTKQASGGGGAAEHTAATSYPVDVGLGIIGHSGAVAGNGGAGVGFTTALQIGGGGAWGVLGGADGSRIGTGIDLSDFLTYGIRIRGRHSAGTGPAISVAAGAGSVAIGLDAPSAPIHARRPSAGVAGILDAGDGGSSYSAYLQVQGRARFGFDSTGLVVIDDAGTTKDVNINLGGSDRVRIYGQGTQAGRMRVFGGRITLGSAEAHIIGDSANLALRLNGTAPTGNIILQNEDASASYMTVGPNGTKIVGNVGFFNTTPVAQSTGWGTPTGTTTKTTFDTATVTLPQLAERVKGLIDALKAYGQLGA